MKKCLSLILAFVILLISLNVLSASVGAADPASGFCGDNLTWEYDSRNYTLTISGTGAMTDYGMNLYGRNNITSAPWGSRFNLIGKVIIGNGVTSIGNCAFCNCSISSLVEIPDSVTHIGDCAFYNCSKLGRVEISDSVLSIGDNAFSGCSALNYNTFDNACYLGNKNNPFVALVKSASKDITSCIIADTTKVICYSAFSSCSSLTSVTIPDSVISIGRYSFQGCTGLTSMTIPNSVTSISEGTFSSCTHLDSVNITDSVRSIERHAFFGCTLLKSVTIPDSVTSIGENAFYDCNSLNEIKVSNNNYAYSSIDGVLFNKAITELIQYPIGNARREYIIPNSVTSISDYAFFDCENITSVILPDSITNIGECAFLDCENITSITIPEFVTSIGRLAFNSCSSLSEIIVSENNNTYSSFDGVLYNKTRTILIQYLEGNTRTTYIIPNGVICIGEEAFLNCMSLISVTLPDSVMSIGQSAFGRCTKLSSVTIPKSVNNIDLLAFENCISLTSMYYSGTKVQLEQLKQIIGSGNDYLLNANTHYVGDLDGDDDIAATDVVLLRRYLAGYESSIIDF